LCIKIRQNNLYLPSLPRISANLNENYRRYNFQALTNIYGNFRKISGTIKFPENVQPYMLCSRTCHFWRQRSCKSQECQQH